MLFEGWNIPIIQKFKLKGGIFLKKAAFFIAVTMILLTSFVSAQNYTGKVIAVTDSSNISVVYGSDSATVRLNCAACPVAGQPFAAEAQKFLENLILNKTVEVNVVWMDHDNRQVSKVFINGKSVGAQLASAGYAWYDSRSQQDAEIAQAQVQAQAQKIAIWSLPNPIAPWTFLTNQRGIIPDTSSPPTNIGNKSVDAPPITKTGDEGTSWDTTNQPLSTSAYGYGYGYYPPAAWGNVNRGAVVNAQSNRGSVSRGTVNGGGRR